MLRFSLELYLSALRLNLQNAGFDRKLAVLNLAQCVELAIKAALVEENESIFEKEAKTINTHKAREALSAKWKAPFPFRARIELLVDERNAMQHRYGDVDPHTLAYHLDTVTDFLRSLLTDKFEMDLDEYVRLTDQALATSSTRFIRTGPAPVVEGVAAPSSSRVRQSTAPVGATESDAIGDLVAEFAVFERTIRDRVRHATGDEASIRSILDVTMKFAAQVEALRSEVRRIPGIFSLRNATVHGTLSPNSEQLDEAHSVLSAVTSAIMNPDNLAELREAVRASLAGVRGTRLLARTQADEKELVTSEGSKPDESVA